MTGIYQTTEPDPERVKRLADLLHEQEIGCRNKPTDRFDIGMPWEHTGDHEKVARAMLDCGRVRVAS